MNAAAELHEIRVVEQKKKRPKGVSSAGVVTVVGIICKEALHGAYIITPALLPELKAYTSPQRTFQPSPWSIKRRKTGSVSALLVSTWISGHDNVLAALVAYMTENIAATIQERAPPSDTDFAPKMAGDRETRKILGRVFDIFHVDGHAGSKIDGTIHGINCQYKKATPIKGRYRFIFRQQAGLILDANQIPVLILTIFEKPAIFIVIATRTITGEPTLGGLVNPTIKSISVYRDSTAKCGFRNSMKCEMSVFAMDPAIDQSADVLIALRECDRRLLITADRMTDIKALEAAALTREQPMKSADMKRRREAEKAKQVKQTKHADTETC